MLKKKASSIGFLDRWRIRRARKKQFWALDAVAACLAYHYMREDGNDLMWTDGWKRDVARHSYQMADALVKEGMKYKRSI